LAAQTALDLIAVAVSIVAAVMDIRTRRIPNRLTYPTMLGAIAGRTLLQGWHGAVGAVLGGLVGGGLFVIFFLLHAMGAGDVKLVAGIGCLLGPQRTFHCVLATAIIGGVIALFHALARRRLQKTLKNIGHLFRFFVIFGASVHPTLNLSEAEAVRMPYAVPVALGVFFTVWVTVREVLNFLLTSYSR
jgi:prepilin peptidase CpaA